MGYCRRGEHIRGSWPSRGGREHETLSQFFLGVTDGCHCHGLFVLAAVQGQFFTVFIKSLTQANDISMAENTKTAAKQPLTLAIDLDMLRSKMSNQSLRHRQPNSFCGHVDNNSRSILTADYKCGLTDLQPVAKRF